ncbi:unnamed protein product [Nesidiocoris tenuis]|uniref:Uncharacterized protein n=1 Tax=Nesidiocoris tenuis TaxID=355587 RepID=A0A6H5HV64_9HEMI|nr:unnamed protein product [Nesidiocoris tenuis]
MVNLKQDNERLQRIVTSKSLTSSQSSLPRTDSLERRFSMNDALPDCKYDLFAGDPDGKRVSLSVFLGCHGSYHRYVEDPSECVVACLSVSGKTKWEMLDAMIRKAFKKLEKLHKFAIGSLQDYIERIDPVNCLGLCTDSIWSYHIGEVVRYKDSKLPELLPCGYLIGDVNNISVCLKGALHSGNLDALAFDTLVPKPIIQSVEHKSSKELRQYLANIAEQCENNAGDLPSVIILDNLHQASSLTEVFNGFLKAKFNKCPFIIGTMNQTTCSTTNLQLHHNFRYEWKVLRWLHQLTKIRRCLMFSIFRYSRWILCANHMEPVKGFLGRYLKRKLIEMEAKAGCRNSELARITEWVPRAWLHLNQFLEAHSSSDVTIGPRLFLNCPMDSDGSQVWFTDLWNYSVVPYLMEAVREGIQVYGKRTPWQDPAQYICHTYPWAGEAVQGGPEALIRLRPEDVGYEVLQTNSSAQQAKKDPEPEPDPLRHVTDGSADADLQLIPLVGSTADGHITPPFREA